MHIVLELHSGVASPKIQSRYANVRVFIDCENNQFLKKCYQNLQSGIKFSAGYATDCT